MNRNVPRLRPAFLALWMFACGQPARADEMMRQVQEELRKRHLYFGDVDGRDTQEISAAIRRYQERKGFQPSGQPDDETLRSLSLLPPSPPSVAGPAASPNDVAGVRGSETAFLFWPDVTVLRSDQGRPAASKAADETGTPPALPHAEAQASPSPPGASIPQPDLDAVRAFIGQYVRAGETNDPEAELRFYAERVDYFEDGVVDHAFISRDVRRYEKRWPVRQFSVEEPVTVTSAPTDPPKTTVRFRYRFSVKGARYAVSGETENEYVLTGSRPDELRIVSMKEQRVRPASGR